MRWKRTILPCPPWPPCCPAFSLRARLTNPSGKVDPSQSLPFEVIVTNYEYYAWSYLQSDYGLYVFDEYGCFVPNALSLPRLFRRIDVPPRVSVIDLPQAIRLRMKHEGGPLELGRTYTLVVTLCGRQSQFQFTPFLERGKDAVSYYPPMPVPIDADATDEARARTVRSGEASPGEKAATILVSVEPDAELFIDGYRTETKGGQRKYVTPLVRTDSVYGFTVSATVVRGEKTFRAVERIRFRGGETVRLDLDFGPRITASK